VDGAHLPPDDTRGGHPVVKVLRLLSTALLLVSVDACDVLFNGVFPGALTQATARADLGGRIDTGPASSFSLSTVRAGGREYVVLFSSSGFDSSRTHLVIMDPHLSIIATYTLDALVPAAPSGIVSGSYTMTDVNDDIVIGNLFFTVLADGTLSPTGNPAGVTLFSPSHSLVFPPDFFHEINYTLSATSMTWQEYTSTWGSDGPFSCALGAPSASIRLAYLFSDHLSVPAPDVFVFQDDAIQRTYFVPVPKADIDVDLNVAVPDFFTHYGPSTTVKDKLDMNSIAVSDSQVIAYDEDKRSLVRFTLDAPGTISSLSTRWVNGMKGAAGISGSFYVVWDPVSRSVTRYEQWW
jgi:hypothetical protein